jgi:hypothetical protein
MNTKIIFLVILFIISSVGLLGISSSIINIPFKSVYGEYRKSSEEKKSYWIGHLITVSIVFGLWMYLTAESPTLALVFVIVLPCVRLIVVKQRQSNLEGVSIYSALMWNTIIFYIGGLILGKINFVWF